MNRSLLSLCKGETMAPVNKEALRKSVLALLSKQLEGKKAEIVAEETDTIPSSKELVHRFVVRPADEPNGPHLTIALDASGRSVDLPRLALAEGKVFFPAPEHKIELPEAIL